MRYEFKIAKGYTLEQLEGDINQIGNIRDEEIKKAIGEGYEVRDFEYNHFKPMGGINLTKDSSPEDIYTLVMGRKL